MIYQITMSTLLSASLDKQIDHFIASLKDYNNKRPYPRSEKDYAYLQLFFKDFLRDQNSRAVEVASSEYHKVLKYINEQIPLKTMFNLCIDGRVLALLAFGAPALIGSSMRVPGGMLREFIRGTNGKLTLKPNTNYANLLIKVFGLYNQDSIAEVYDSHVACAARLSEEQSKGRMPDDFGLYADVSHKKQIAQASITFIKECFQGKKRIIPMQTSFDPHSGYMYMGLETASAMQYGGERGGRFTNEILKHLVEHENIISTEEIASEIEVEEILARHYFKLDWKHDYTASARLFWEAVAELKATLGPLIEKKVLQVYPELESNVREKRLEKEERVLLLLANTLSGYLHNHSNLNQKNGTVEAHVHLSHYPYGIHEEQSVLVSEGGYPPNAMAYFVVFSLGETNLASNIEISDTLVRNNRRDKRVKDDYKIFSSTQELVEASVPVIVQEVIRDPLTDEQWEALTQISWNDMPKRWEEVSDLEFLTYLQSKKGMTIGVMMGINNLRRRMAVLYNLSNPTSSHLVEHYKVALPVITNRYRKNEFIVPFVKLGFS